MEHQENEKIKLSKNNAIIFEEDLDTSSGYTHLYLSSVIHADVRQLKATLKRQFSLINSKGIVPIEEYENIENVDDFETEIKNVNLDEAREIIVDSKDDINYNGVFNYALLVTFLTLLVQLAFFITIIKEYHLEPTFPTDDHELICMRILSFITLSIYLWTEYRNGRKKLNHAVYQGFLYQSLFKRFVSGFFGGFQMFSAFACYYTSGELLVRNENVMDCVLNFTALVILIEVDDWFGDYFLMTSKELQFYSRDYIKQIWCIDKHQLKQYTIVDLLEDICCIAVFLLVAGPLYYSIKL